VPGLAGRISAAPILFDAFARSGKVPAALPKAPRGVLFASNTQLPPPLQRFRPGTLVGQGTEPPIKILFPPQGARLELVQSAGKAEPVAVKVAGGVPPLTVMVNGVPVGDRASQRTLFFAPDGPGFLRLTVMDAKGAADSVMVRVQ
jgi:penicillin-binding protein 1C